MHIEKENIIVAPIAEIDTKNYKNLSNGKVTLTNLNVLIGPNGSGKNNFIGLLQFLQNNLSKQD